MDPSRVLGMTARLSQLGLRRTRSILPRYNALRNLHTTSTNCDAHSNSSQTGALPPLTEDQNSKIDDIYTSAMQGSNPPTSTSTSRMSRYGFGLRSKAASTKTLDILSGADGAAIGVPGDLLDVARSKTLGSAFPSKSANQQPQPVKKLTPTTGRVVEVNSARGMDVGRAFRQLSMVCNRNNVRSDLTKQRFHERPGLKRKRLRYERKIREFDAKFKKVVSMVRAMAKQGW